MPGSRHTKQTVKFAAVGTQKKLGTTIVDRLFVPRGVFVSIVIEPRAFGARLAPTALEVPSSSLSHEFLTIFRQVPLGSDQNVPTGNRNPAHSTQPREGDITRESWSLRTLGQGAAAGRLRCTDANLEPLDSNPTCVFPFVGNKWGKKHLTYKIINAPQGDDAERYRVQNTLTRALKLWSDASPLSFYEAKEDEDADIVVKFTRGDHSDGYPFDGGVLDSEPRGPGFES
ncbi:metalloendopeptidase [Branchiostoma belcheri]|nr:metalloendopeptidase [Branchiostoma belcheri]